MSISENSDERQSQVSSDYITVLTVTGRGNKLVSRAQSGAVKKQAGPPVTEATAQTHLVEDSEALMRVLHDISDNPKKILSLGYVRGTEPDPGAMLGKPYKFTSKKILGKILEVDPDTPEGLAAFLGWHEIDGARVICRLKANMSPGTWCLFDIDAVRGMPDKLANLDSQGRRDALAEIIPGFVEAGVVIVPSTTGRVLIDGKPMDATGEHFYVQIKDASDLERFGAVLLQRSLLGGFGFMRHRYSRSKPDEVVASVPWGIADPTTFSHERLVYDGAPTVNGVGLEVANVNISICDGGRLDTSLLLDLTDDEATTYAEMTGQRIVKERRTTPVLGGDGKVITRNIIQFGAVDERQLNMDTKIDTQAGVMTLIEYWQSDHGKLRCQTPFRESSSWNGILNRHKDGTPFVYDNGIRSRYVLSTELVRKRRADIYLARLAVLAQDEVKKTWTDGLRWMEPHEHEQVRQRVHKLTGIGLKELSAELKSAAASWANNAAKCAATALLDEIKRTGKTVVKLGSVDIADTLRQVEEILFVDRDVEPVMSHGDRLVSVRMATPTTVREVRRGRDATVKNAPLALVVDPHQFHGLTMRLSQAVTFIKKNKDGKWEETPPPGNVVRAMLEQSHKRAPALVGIIEHPVMTPAGDLYGADGLSEDGLFVRISEDLLPTLEDTITPQMAHASLRWIVDDALADFPFASEIDKAGAVAALLTAIQRRMFDRNEGCPGFLTTAPIQASGKTAFFQLLFELVWGRTAAATNWSSSDEELGKHILAILLEGHGGVLFDNLEEGGRIESNALARAMTSPKFTGRVLSENRQATVPTNCLWCFTGNNISASGDFNTRILPISIDPGTEHPDQRIFARPDLAEWCENHRAEFYYHAMTIMVGYQRYLLAEGDPVDVKPTRYVNWDKQIRHAMIWAGSADPAELFEQNKVEDPKREGRRNFLAEWHGAYGGQSKLLSDVLHAVGNVYAHSIAGQDEHLRSLNDAIRDLLPNGSVTSRNLSAVIRKFAGQWVDGYRITAERAGESSHHAKRWLVECQET